MRLLRPPDASDRDAAAIAGLLQAILAEISSFGPQPEDADELYLRQLRERGRARRAYPAARDAA